MHREDFVFSTSLRGCLVIDDTSDRTPNFQQAAELPKKILTAATWCSAWDCHLFCFLTEQIILLGAAGCVFSTSVLAGLIWCPFPLFLAIAQTENLQALKLESPRLLQVCSHVPLALRCLNSSSSINYIFMLYFVKVLEHIDSPDSQSKAGIAC